MSRFYEHNFSVYNSSLQQLTASNAVDFECTYELIILKDECVSSFSRDA